MTKSLGTQERDYFRVFAPFPMEERAGVRSKLKTNETLDTNYRLY